MAASRDNNPEKDPSKPDAAPESENKEIPANEKAEVKEPVTPASGGEEPIAAPSTIHETAYKDLWDDVEHPRSSETKQAVEPPKLSETNQLTSNVAIAFAAFQSDFKEIESKISSQEYKAIGSQLSELIATFTTAMAAMENELEELAPLKQAFPIQIEAFKKKLIEVYVRVYAETPETIENEPTYLALVQTLEKLEKKMGFLTFPTAFDDNDTLLKEVRKSTKKEEGANIGYQITNNNGIRFTVKQGSTIGNTLSEVFTALSLQNSVAAEANLGNMDEAKKMGKKIIASAFLTIKTDELESKDIAVRCKKSLFAASRWSSDKYSFEGCQLVLGLPNRLRMAGTLYPQEFEDLRTLNQILKLGLEKILIPTALKADFDLHTKNFMLKIDVEHIPDEHQIEADGLIKDLIRAMAIKPADDRQAQKANPHRKEPFRLKKIVDAVEKLRALGANVFLHKIDHDAGHYRFAHPERNVDWTDHHTSPFYIGNAQLKTQPTNHTAEITGDVEGMNQVLLSDEAINLLFKTDLETELAIELSTASQLYDIVNEKAKIIAGKHNDALEVEKYLLHAFYYHLTKETIENIEELDEVAIQNKINNKLKDGTVLKVLDQHKQLYKRLLEKVEANDPLSPKQVELKNWLEQKAYILQEFPVKAAEQKDSAPKPSKTEKEAAERADDAVKDALRKLLDGAATGGLVNRINRKFGVSQHEAKVSTIGKQFKRFTSIVSKKDDPQQVAQRVARAKINAAGINDEFITKLNQLLLVKPEDRTLVNKIELIDLLAKVGITLDEPNSSTNYDIVCSQSILHPVLQKMMGNTYLEGKPEDITKLNDFFLVSCKLGWTEDDDDNFAHSNKPKALKDHLDSLNVSEADIDKPLDSKNIPALRAYAPNIDSSDTIFSAFKKVIEAGILKQELEAAPKKTTHAKVKPAVARAPSTPAAPRGSAIAPPPPPPPSRTSTTPSLSTSSFIVTSSASSSSGVSSSSSGASSQLTSSGSTSPASSSSSSGTSSPSVPSSSSGSLPTSPATNNNANTGAPITETGQVLQGTRGRRLG